MPPKHTAPSQMALYVVQEALTTMIDAVAFKCTRIEQLFAVQGISNIRTQDFYRIMRWCITPAAINHLLRTVSPNAMRTYAARFDEITYSLLLKTLGLDPHGLAVSTSTPKGTLVAARTRLRASLGGLSLTSAVLTSKPVFLGGAGRITTINDP